MPDVNTDDIGGGIARHFTDDSGAIYTAPRPADKPAMPLADNLLRAEADFRGEPWIHYLREHTEIPVFAVCVYFAIVFYLPQHLRHRAAFRLRAPFAAWNLVLAVFSLLGAARTVPHLARAVQRDGFRSTVCRDPREWYLDGAVGMWVALFIVSKLPELLDTVFLVLQKKNVIFLHWFHHVTVMLYCWHAFANCVASGLWFVCMNLVVHSAMYSYYFLMAVRLYRVATPFAPLITAMQILQMAAGSLVTAVSAVEYYAGGPDACAVHPANFKLGLAMYACYMVLFGLLFYTKYLDSGEVCGVDVHEARVDITGRFAHVQPRVAGARKRED